MNTRYYMVIIKGEIKTSEIMSCVYNRDTQKWDVKFNNGKTYSYAYSNVEWLKDPQILNPEMYRISREGREFFDIRAIYVFRSVYESYWHAGQVGRITKGKVHMEIIRRDELQELLEVVRMNPYGKFLITGVSGSGKTFLLNIIGKILEEQGKEICYEILSFSQIGNKIWKRPSEYEDIVCLVDGLDEKYRYKQITEYIKNSRGCYICTARENKFDIKFDYEIKLKPLTDNQILLFVSDYLGTRISSENIVEDVIKGLDKQNLMPRMIAEKLHTKLKGEELNEYFLDFEKDIYQLYTYKGGVSCICAK